MLKMKNVENEKQLRKNRKHFDKKNKFEETHEYEST